MSVDYPDKISGKIVMTKDPRRIFLEFRPEVTQKERENFFEEKKGLLNLKAHPAFAMKRVSIGREFRPETIPSIRKVALSKSAVKAKNVFDLAKEDLSATDYSAALKELEKDDRVLELKPIYHREDLKYPNSFTFDSQLLVKFKIDVDQEKIDSYLRILGVIKVRDLGEKLSLFKIVDTRANVLNVADAFRKRAEVQYVNINWIQMHNPACSNVDVHALYFSDQWNLGQIAVIDAWKTTKGSPLVVVAVIDSGCAIDHPSLKSQLVQSDRWHDFTKNDNQPTDRNGHGTLCAGIASAMPNSLLLPSDDECSKVAGVGYNCRIMPIRIFCLEDVIDEPRLDALRIIDALNFARCVEKWDTPVSKWKSPRHAHVVSMSFSFDGADLDAIDDAIQECHDSGMVLVAAAGNFGASMPGKIDYPASNKNVIAVGASDRDDSRCVWGLGMCQESQYGPELSVVAPGVDIYGPDLRDNAPDDLMNTLRQGMGGYLPQKLLFGFNNLWDYLSYFDYDNATGNTPQQPRHNIGDPNGDYYFRFMGTSAATPHVAGLAGLILSYNPDLSPDQVRQIIEKTADKVGNVPNGYDQKGWSIYMGFGRINSANALKEAKTNYAYQPVDVYIRKVISDVGDEPFEGTHLCSSPDIIMLTESGSASIGDPQRVFADLDAYSDENIFEIGEDNFLYIRVHNKGAKKSNIHVRLYSVPYSSRFKPHKWVFFNQYDFYDVAPGTMAISEPIVCRDFTESASGKYFCIVASIEGFGDCHPDVAGLDVTNTKEHIIASNNVALRKIKLI